MKRPVILVTPDVAMRQSIGVDWRIYELKAAYCDAVVEAGGLPWVAPYCEDAGAIDELIARADGLLLTGGDFDIDPRVFGARPHPKLGTLKPGRTAFELELFKRARAADLPTLGICGGMQLMNVECGGTLYQDLPDERPGPVEHSQRFDRRHPAHRVNLVAGSLLLSAFGQSAVKVNSSHHQAVRELGAGVSAAGVAEDGLVEAIEVGGMTLGIGVQWHPETLLPSEDDPTPRAIYASLVAGARKRNSR